MVLKRRQYYGFTDFHVSSVPRAPRSARRRDLHKEKANDSQICAFELLASLAGKLLQEGKSCSSNENESEANGRPALRHPSMNEEQGDGLPLKKEYHDRGSCEENAFRSKFVSLSGDQKCFLQEIPHPESDSVPEHSSVITNFDSSEKVSSHLKSVICKSKTTSKTFAGKLEAAPDCYFENRFNGQQGGDKLHSRGLTINNACSSKSPADFCMKKPALVKSDSNVRSLSCRSGSVLGHRNSVKQGIRDDDEKFSRYRKANIMSKVFRIPSRIGDRRIRKLLTSKYWRVAPKLKDFDTEGDGRTKPLCHKRKVCYHHERYQHDMFYKRRKFSANGVVVTSDGGFSCESDCNLPEKGMNAEKNGLDVAFHTVKDASSSVSHQPLFRSRDCPDTGAVRFGIKSIRVPELLIDVPETATVGSLKRTIMDTVTAILEGGLCVGVVLHGKKVIDDSKTLSQTGIASKENIDTLGFTLEPIPVQASPPFCGDDASILQCDTSQLVARSPASPVSGTGISEALPESSPPTNLGNNVENSHGSSSSLSNIVPDKTHPDHKALVAIQPTCTYSDVVTDKTHSDSKALVAIPPVDAEALAVVPMNQKSRRLEILQRRTRRPFSVSEVEALVEVVEEIGTGRWRDVKLRSFENTDHRTYVDLKDKWKTLVHTAKIAPQQRRGKPVPQELLDRVLAAHAYWSEHQANQHNQNQTVTMKITE